MLLIIPHIFIVRKLFANNRVLCDGGILMCSTALVHNHLISLVLLCYKDVVLLQLVFSIFPKYLQIFLFLHFISDALFNTRLVSQILSSRSLYFFSLFFLAHPLVYLLLF